MNKPRSEQTPLDDAGDCGASTAAAECGASGESFGTIIRRLGPAGPLALVSATLPALGGFLLLGLLTTIEPHLKAWDGLGVLIYIVMFALLAGFAVLPTYAQAVLGGWVYRFPLGFPAALAGILGGSLVGYAVGRRAAGDRLVQLIAERPKWQAVQEALLGSGFWRTLLIVTLLRLNSPFALTNFVLAATRVNLVAYAIGTVVGLSPRTAVSVVAAVGLKELTFEKSGNKVVWIATIVVTVVVVLIISHIANTAIARVTAGEQGGKSAPEETK